MRSSIGPVEDLKNYVRADWWRDLFNADYLRTDGDFVDDSEITESLIDAFLEMPEFYVDRPAPDLCGGQVRHVLPGRAVIAIAEQA